MQNKHDKGYPKYLFVISYEGGSLMDRTATQQWQGRAREVKKMLSYTQEQIRKDLNQVKDELKSDQSANEQFIVKLKKEIKDIKKNIQDVYQQDLGISQRLISINDAEDKAEEEQKELYR